MLGIFTLKFAKPVKLVSLIPISIKLCFMCIFYFSLFFFNFVCAFFSINRHFKLEESEVDSFLDKLLKMDSVSDKLIEINQRYVQHVHLRDGDIFKN